MTLAHCHSPAIGCRAAKTGSIGALHRSGARAAYSVRCTKPTSLGAQYRRDPQIGELGGTTRDALLTDASARAQLLANNAHR
jgi:hypothetical protein